MFNDLRFAIRALKKAPGFALTAILTLALGIGANAVVFSVMNAVVLHPVNVPQRGISTWCSASSIRRSRIPIMWICGTGTGRSRAW